MVDDGRPFGGYLLTSNAYYNVFLGDVTTAEPRMKVRQTSIGGDARDEIVQRASALRAARQVKVIMIPRRRRGPPKSETLNKAFECNETFLQRNLLREFGCSRF